MRLAAAAVVLLLGLAGAAHAEAPEVEAASDTVAVHRPPPVERSPDIAVHGRRPARNSVAGVPGTVVTVSFPPGSAELDERQMRALWRLTRDWRADAKVKMLWVRARLDGGDHDLARKRAEKLRRATGGQGFPWDKVFMDRPDICEADCAKGVITVIEKR